MKIEKTNDELMHFNRVGAAYVKKTKDAKTKLTTSIESVFKQLKPVFIDYNETVKDLRLDNCAVDPKTNVLLPKDENGEYRFTIEGVKKFNKDVKKLLDKKVQIETKITEANDALIPTLTEEERFAFSEIVISKQLDEDEIITE